MATRHFSEDEHTELKGTWNNRSLKTVSAFANESGGTIFVGVEDDGNVIGIENPDNMCTAITSSISDNVRPDPIGMVSLEILDVEGKSVISVRVDAGPNRPYYLKEKGLREGGVFIRRGTSSVAAPQDMIMKMVREGPISYESLISIRQDLTFETTERIFRENDVPFGERQMESLKMKSGGAYTNLGFMLSDQFDQGVKMAVYPDRYKGEFLDRDEASGSVLDQFVKAYEFVDKHNSKRSRIVGPRRIDTRDYPEEAVREAIVNAIAHRDYGIQGDITISMYPDRMVVLSVGGLNTGIGMDDVLAGVSSRRNRDLVSVLYRLKMVEAYGTGIPRIMGTYRNQPVKPKISCTTNSFKIMLPVTIPDELSEDEVRVMDMLDSRQEIRRRDVEECLGVSKTKASYVIRVLKEKGIIDGIGSGKDQAYRMKFEY